MLSLQLPPMLNPKFLSCVSESSTWPGLMEQFTSWYSRSFLLHNWSFALVLLNKDDYTDGDLQVGICAGVSQGILYKATFWSFESNSQRENTVSIFPNDFFTFTVSFTFKRLEAYCLVLLVASRFVAEPVVTGFWYTFWLKGIRTESNQNPNYFGLK